MANEHIGRLEKIGLGKESVPGTPVAATDWFAKVDGVFKPSAEKARDEAAYGTIDELRDSQTVKQNTELTLNGIARDTTLGHILLAWLGTEVPTLRCVTSGGSGTLVVGETVTQAVSSATGVIKRIENTTTVLISITSGTFTSGSNLITGGTSSATKIITFDSALRTHFFQRLNSNNHPAYTLYGVDDVGTYRAAYGMLKQIELSLAANDFARFATSWQAHKEGSTSSTPAFATSDSPWLGKHANLYLATDIAGLAAAIATPITSFKITGVKNLEEYQAFGNVDVISRHNKQFSVYGELSAIFNTTTLKDLNLAGTKKAMRLKLANTDVTIGSAGNPELWVDLAQVSFKDWGKQAGNNDLVMQTLAFEMEFKVSEAEGIVAWLQNTRTTAY